MDLPAGCPMQACVQCLNKGQRQGGATVLCGTRTIEFKKTINRVLR